MSTAHGRGARSWLPEHPACILTLGGRCLCAGCFYGNLRPRMTRRPGSINDSPINRLGGSCWPGLALLEASRCPGLGPGDTASATRGTGRSGTGLALEPCSGPRPEGHGPAAGHQESRGADGQPGAEGVRTGQGQGTPASFPRRAPLSLCSQTLRRGALPG